VKKFAVAVIVFCLFQAVCPASLQINPLACYRRVKIMATTYRADRFSDIGCYRRVSKNGKRMGNFVALNFLPGGSVVMIPKLFKTTKFIVADTFGKTGIGKYKDRKYWKVDILRNRGEWIDDFDFPLELYVVKYNRGGLVKNAGVRANCRRFMENTTP
jgi:hypothetical protein